MSEQKTQAQDERLAEAAAALIAASLDAQDLIWEAQMYGWGRDSDNEPWPENRPDDVHLALVRATHGVQQAIREGGYFPDDEDEEGGQP
jgi:hypothetical protein